MRVAHIVERLVRMEDLSRALGPEELLQRLELDDTEDREGYKCPVCKNLDGTGKRYNYSKLDASSVLTDYNNLVRSRDLGCTFCAWLAYAITSQACYDLAWPNAQVQVRFEVGRSVQIYEVDFSKPKEDMIVLEMFTPDGKSFS
jgi:hypothetical protein